MTTQPSYAFFDFDGTLIAEDSFLTLLSKGLKGEPWRFFLILIFIPLLLITAIFKINKIYAKSALLWCLTFGKSKKAAIRFLRETAASECDKMWFKEAIPILENLKKNGVEIILVSASGQTWIRAMLAGKFQNFKMIIGSKLGFFAGGVILKSKNCYGEEKLKRIEQMLGKNFIWQSTWSDHIADLPMFWQAQERYVICPREKHIEIFQRELNNYVILRWNKESY